MNKHWHALECMRWLRHKFKLAHSASACRAVDWHTQIHVSNTFFYTKTYSPTERSEIKWENWIPQMRKLDTTTIGSYWPKEHKCNIFVLRTKKQNSYWFSDFRKLRILTKTKSLSTEPPGSPPKQKGGTLDQFRGLAPFCKLPSAHWAAEPQTVELVGRVK